MTGRQDVRQGVRLAARGAFMGLVLAWLGGGALRSLLFGVEPFDPLVFLAGPGLVLAVTALSAYLPARRATRVDPLAALRGGE